VSHIKWSVRRPVEAKPEDSAGGAAVDSPVAVSGDGGHDLQAAPALVVVGFLLEMPPSSMISTYA